MSYVICNLFYFKLLIVVIGEFGIFLYNMLLFVDKHFNSWDRIKQFKVTYFLIFAIKYYNFIFFSHIFYKIKFISNFIVVIGEFCIHRVSVYRAAFRRQTNSLHNNQLFLLLAIKLYKLILLYCTLYTIIFILTLPFFMEYFVLNLISVIACFLILQDSLTVCTYCSRYYIFSKTQLPVIYFLSIFFLFLLLCIRS